MSLDSNSNFVYFRETNMQCKKELTNAYLIGRMSDLNEHLEPLENFILPGGSKLIANYHMAIAICRRAERCATALDAEAAVNPAALQFLNRLSDYLFVVARSCARITDIPEVLWEKG